MPTLADYQGLAPFSLDELVDASNSVLRDRPKLHVSKRTVRYYIQSGVLPPPQGSPKYARYGMDHLVRLVGARCLLDEGLPLQAAARQLESLVTRQLPQAIEHVQRLVDSQRRPKLAAEYLVMESAPRVAGLLQISYDRRDAPELPMDVHDVRRIPLTDEATLELRVTADPKQALREAAEALSEILKEY